MRRSRCHNVASYSYYTWLNNDCPTTDKETSTYDQFAEADGGAGGGGGGGGGGDDGNDAGGGGGGGGDDGDDAGLVGKRNTFSLANAFSLASSGTTWCSIWSAL